MKIRKIPERFEKWKDKFVQIDREGDIAFFVRELTGGGIAYEVIKIRLTEPHPRSLDTRYDKIEKYPSDNEFGTFGWSFNGDNAFQRRAAYEKFKELTRRKNGNQH